eukprot:COSAG04_NODE_20510_length_392_cov_0.409556_1_plen_27_part_10
MHAAFKTRQQPLTTPKRRNAAYYSSLD